MDSSRHKTSNVEMLNSPNLTRINQQDIAEIIRLTRAYLKQILVSRIHSFSNIWYKITTLVFLHQGSCRKVETILNKFRKMLVNHLKFKVSRAQDQISISKICRVFLPDKEPCNQNLKIT